MKKTVKVNSLIRCLREARRVYQLSADDSGITWHASRLLGTIAYHLAQELGLDPSTPEYTRFMDRVWGKRKPQILAGNPGIDKTVSKSTQYSPECLALLRIQANRACTCDGGNTNGCSACVAERRLKQYEATAGHHQTNAERTCP